MGSRGAARRPAPHVHGREEEGAYVLDGEVTLKGERVVAGAGTFAYDLLLYRAVSGSK